MTKCVRSLRIISVMTAITAFPDADLQSLSTRTQPRRRASSQRIVTACIRYAEATQYQSVSLDDLCMVSSVSERRVRHAFYECLGTSPTGYLRAAALNEVRRVLLQAPPNRDAVTRAATDYGFWHLSRFASQYRALFGESPSATLARARAAEAIDIDDLDLVDDDERVLVDA